MILDVIFVSAVATACAFMVWVHFGKDPDGKEFSFRFKICTCWIGLMLIGIINILYYVIKPEPSIFNLIIGLVSFVEIGTEAILVVCRLDKELEKSEE